MAEMLTVYGNSYLSLRNVKLCINHKLIPTWYQYDGHPTHFCISYIYV